jgi:hypothetical protein
VASLAQAKRREFATIEQVEAAFRPRRSDWRIERKALGRLNNPVDT